MELLPRLIARQPLAGPVGRSEVEVKGTCARLSQLDVPEPPPATLARLPRRGVPMQLGTYPEDVVAGPWRVVLVNDDEYHEGLAWELGRHGVTR